jgi:uncharacterized membrane protein YeiH
LLRSSRSFIGDEKKLDPFGVLVLAFVTAIGGGTLRDILIGNLPVSWLSNETATVVYFASRLWPCYSVVISGTLQQRVFI